MKNRVAVGLSILIVAFAFESYHGAHAQQRQSSVPLTSVGLSVPFTTMGTAQAGSAAVAGVFRITQFLEQNGRAFATGTLAIGLGDAAAPRTLVQQVAVPVLVVRSASSSSSLTLGGASPPVTPGSFAGFSATMPAAGTTATDTTAASVGTASAAIPGVQANCGPLHLEIGPFDQSTSGLSFHLDRLVLDLAAPADMVSSASALMCSADAALAQASGVSPSGTPGTTAFTSSFTAPNPSLATSTAAGTATTPLQSLVAVLNQIVDAF